MSDARWTIDGDGYLVYPEGESIWDIYDLVAGIQRGSDWSMPAFDALVAAVRDADLLQQARQLAAALEGTNIVQWSPTLESLVDLLAPVSGTGTPTPGDTQTEAEG